MRKVTFVEMVLIALLLLLGGGFVFLHLDRNHEALRVFVGKEQERRGEMEKAFNKELQLLVERVRELEKR